MTYSLVTGLKQTFPDRDFGLFECLYHVQLAANTIINQILDKHGSSGRFMSTYTDLPVLYDNKLNLPYFVIPQQVYDMSMEGGLTQLWYNIVVDDTCDPPIWTQQQFQPTHFDTMHKLYLNEYTKPKSTNPYFFRVTDNIYLVGVSKIACKTVNTVVYATLDPKDVADLDQEIPLPDEYVEQLYYKVFSLGRFIANVPDERKLIGADKQWEQKQERDQPIQQTQQQ